MTTAVPQPPGAVGSSDAPLPEAAVRFAVDEERERIAHEVLGQTMRRLGRLGFELAAVTGQVDGAASRRLAASVEEVDEILSELRAAVFEVERRSL